MSAGIGAGVENQWELFCATIGRADLIDDPRFDLPHLRTEHHAELEPILIEALRHKTAAEWLAEFDAIGLPCGPLNDIAQAAAHPQVQARHMLTEVEHPRIGSLTVADTPVKLSRTPGAIKGPPPSLGEHTREVLSALLGLSQTELDELAEAGVIVGQHRYTLRQTGVTETSA
jgi:CoA:oxalate CoA-transferase